jgi:transcriptional regulator with XRE-family HTH domain
MIPVIQHLTIALKTARAEKNWSQRQLSKTTGLPQAQISRIENSAVDLKASTLIELARALDLEVMLVPRRHVPTVKGLAELLDTTETQVTVAPPAYTLDDEDIDG